VTATGIEPIILRAGAGAATLRLATPDDNAARCDLFGRVSMESDVSLSVRREPDFDALYRLQSPCWESYVIELDGRVEGTGTILVRDGYLGGERRRVGYLGDLRFSPRVEGRSLLDRFYGPLLAHAREAYGCELFLTTVITSNVRALRALTELTARSRGRGRPRYAPVGDFDIRSIHLLLPKRRDRSGLLVRRANADDVPSIAALLDADARARPFGYPCSVAELERRLHEWPRLGIDSFFLAFEPSGELVGCVALWDARSVKRMIVNAYRGPMRRARLAYDVAARVLGVSRLPVPGQAFEYAYLTHQAVPSGDPRVLRALLTTAYRDARAQRSYHFLSACAPFCCPLGAAYRGFQVTNLRARLFVVALPDVEVPDVALRGAWPGFEMALV